MYVNDYGTHYVLVRTPDGEIPFERDEVGNPISRSYMEATSIAERAGMLAQRNGWRLSYRVAARDRFILH